jgi:hypothetical protein
MEIYLCQVCAHYIGDLKCEAFLDGIPQEILIGENPHEKPLNNQQNDLVFKQKKSDDEIKIEGL